MVVFIYPLMSLIDCELDGCRFNLGSSSFSQDIAREKKEVKGTRNLNSHNYNVGKPIV